MLRGLALGALLIVAGFASAAAIAVPRFLDVKDTIEAFPKTRLSEGSVVLERKEYDVYLDQPASSADAGWTLSVRDPENRELELRPAGGEVTYDWSGRKGSRIGKLRVITPGRHVVRGTGPPGADVVFADELFSDMGRTLLLALAVLFALGLAGVVVIVLALARRTPREGKRWP